MAIRADFFSRTVITGNGGGDLAINVAFELQACATFKEYGIKKEPKGRSSTNIITLPYITQPVTVQFPSSHLNMASRPS